MLVPHHIITVNFPECSCETTLTAVFSKTSVLRTGLEKLSTGAIMHCVQNWLPNLPRKIYDGRMFLVPRAGSFEASKL